MEKFLCLLICLLFCCINLFAPPKAKGKGGGKGKQPTAKQQPAMSAAKQAKAKAKFKQKEQEEEELLAKFAAGGPTASAKSKAVSQPKPKRTIAERQQEGRISEQLLYYIEKNNLSAIQNLNLTPEQINMQHRQVIMQDGRKREFGGATAFLIAAQKGSSDIVQYLLHRGADPNIASDQNVTSLIMAVKNNHIETVRELLRRHDVNANVSVNVPSDIVDGMTALMFAVQEDKVEMVRVLLGYQPRNPDYQVNTNLQRVYDNNTALIFAVQDKKLEIVKALLEYQSHNPNYQVDSNVKNNNNTTALILAAWKDHIDVVNALLEYRPKESKYQVNPNLKGPDDVTALILAADNGNQNIVQELLRYDPVNSLYKIKVNLKGTKGTTAVILASQEGHSDIVRILIESGAGFDLQNNDGATALYFAAKNNHVSVVEILLRGGADPNLQAEDGATPLIVTVQFNREDVVRILLDKNLCQANVNLQDKHGVTALMVAVAKANLEIVKMLLNADAEVDVQDSLGITALMSAVVNNNIEIVRMLLKMDAEVDLETNVGVTALMIAYLDNNERMIQLLERYGAILTQQQLEKVARAYTQAKGTQDTKQVKTTQQAVTQVAKMTLEEALQNQERELRRSIEKLEELESQEAIRRQRLLAHEERSIARLAREGLQKEQSIFQEASQAKGVTSQAKAKKTIEQILQEQGGVSQYQKKEVEAFLQTKLNLVNIQISEEINLRYGFQRNLFNYENVTIDLNHIVNIYIDFDFDFRTQLWRPTFAGGHRKEVVDKLIEQELAEKVSEETWQNQCKKYTLQNVWTDQQFIKTMFPENWSIEDIVKAVMQGAVQKQQEVEGSFDFGKKIELVTLHQGVFIKIILLKTFFEYKIVTAYPVKSVQEAFAETSIAKAASRLAPQAATVAGGGAAAHAPGKAPTKATPKPKATVRTPAAAGGGASANA